MSNETATRIDPVVAEAIGRPQVVDITTTGRRSGLPRRLEIVTHVIDGRTYISGIPRRRPRGWILNLEADPRLTVHLKRGVQADLPARARVITDEAERRAVLERVARAWNRTDLDVMVAFSPLIEVVYEDVPAAP